MDWGTQYTQSSVVESVVSVEVTTFYKQSGPLRMDMKPGDTLGKVRTRLCREHGIGEDEVRLAISGREVSGSDWSLPLARLRVPALPPIRVLFVHEQIIKFFLDPKTHGPNLTLSKSRLSAELVRADGDQTVRGSVALTKGRVYWDVRIDNSKNGRINIGVAIESHSKNQYVGQTPHGWAYYGRNGKREHGGQSHSYGPTYSTGDEIRVLLDMDKRNIAFCINGKQLGVAFNRIPTKVWPAITLYSQRDKFTITKFGTF